MDNQPCLRAFHVGDLDFPVGADDAPRVAHLSAGFHVEGGSGQHQLHVPALKCGVHHGVAGEQAHHLGLYFQRAVGVIAQRLGVEGFHGCRQFRIEAGAGILLHFEIAGGASASTLRLAGGVITRLVHGEALFPRDVFGHLQGQAQRVMEEKGVAAGDVGLADGFPARHDLVEAREALIQRAQKALFLAGEGRHDEIGALRQFRELMAHHFDDQLGQLGHEGAGEA